MPLWRFVRLSHLADQNAQSAPKDKGWFEDQGSEEQPDNNPARVTDKPVANVTIKVETDRREVRSGRNGETDQESRGWEVG